MVQDTAMNDFHECLFNLELADVPCLGPIFTWMNRQEGVDLSNEYCLDMFPNALTELWGLFCLLVLCWLCPYVGGWLLFIRCFLFRADASSPLF